MKTLIIDCGATKSAVAWAGGVSAGPGFNFAHGDVSRYPFPPAEDAGEVYLYAAGITDTRRPEVEAWMRRCYPGARVEAQSDMVGAARALWGTGSGIACILGTGANSCLWDGKGMAAHVSPLGYVLGDEGSGADLGRRFVANVLKRQFCADTLARAAAAVSLTEEDVLRHVYRELFPQRYLGSFAPLVRRLCDSCADVRQMVLGAFLDFFSRNLSTYPAGEGVGFVGGVAWHFREILAEAARRSNRRVGKIIQSPISALVDYHAGVI